MKFSRTELESVGFEGFYRFSVLKSDIELIPDSFGIYVVYRDKFEQPRFLEKSIGGWHKRKDPTRPVEMLKAKWVSNCQMVYIGKAGPTKHRTLRIRIQEFIQFGSGKPVGHAGGSAIWQIDDAFNLLVAWKQTNDAHPREVEKDFISTFIDNYGVMPYANWQR